MGLFGAIVVIPTTVQTGCVGLGGRLGGGEEYRLWANAYDHPADLLRPRVPVPVQ